MKSDETAKKPILGGCLKVTSAALAYAALTILFTYPSALHLGDRIIGQFRNHPLLSIWNLWWVKHALSRPDLSVFRTDYLFYPVDVSLYFHTLAPLYGFLTIPLQAAFGVVVAHNLVILGSFVMAGVAAYLLARHWVGDGWPAFIAGAAYTFSAYHLARAMAHINLVPIEWLPLYALLLFKSASSWRYAAATGVCLLLIALVDLHYLFYCLLLTAWFSLYRLQQARADSAQMRRLVRNLSIVALVFLAAGWPLLWPMVREALSSPTLYPDPAETIYYSADLLSFFVPSQYQFLYGHQFDSVRGRLSQGTFESQNYLGYAFLLLGLAGVKAAWHRKREMATFWGGAAIGFFLLSLGPMLHVAGETRLPPFGIVIPLPYALLQRLPFLGISRVVGRMSVMVLLSLTAPAASGLEAVLAKIGRSKGKRWQAVFASLILGLVLFENWPGSFLSHTPPLLRDVPPVPPFYQQIASDKDSYAVLDIPLTGRIGAYQFFQTVHGKKLSDGFHARIERGPLSGVPLLNELAAEKLDPTPRGRYYLAPIAHLFRYVVLHKEMPGPVAELTSALGDIPPCYEDEMVRVYCPGPSGVYEAEGLPRQTGEVTGDPSASGGATVKGVAGTRAGLVAFGPYAPYCKGTYRACFRLKVGAAAPAQVVAVADVAAKMGANILARREIKGSEAGGSDYQEICLDFTQMDCGVLEFRLYWPAITDIELDRITVQHLGDSPQTDVK